MQSSSMIDFDFSAVLSVTDNSTVNGLILKSNDLMPVEVDQEHFQKLLYVYSVKNITGTTINISNLWLFFFI